MPQSVVETILAWSQDRPIWQRDALRRIFTSNELTPHDLDELAEICKVPHGLTEPRPVTPLATEHLPVSGPVASTPVSLVSLTHHDGVNALAREQTITFGPGITIVYGENGAGKSGYTRILKRACRSRAVEQILGNVLGGTAPPKARATIKIKDGTGETAVAWTPDTNSASALALISVFDANCVPVYLKDKTDVAFRPFGLDVFDRLAGACAEVRKRLEQAMFPLTTSALPALPTITAGTKARQLLDTLTGLTSEKAVRGLTELSPVEDQRLTHLKDLKRDFQTNDPKKRAAELRTKATRVELLAVHLEELAAKLGPEVLTKLGTARTKLQAVRAALSALQKTALTPDLLPCTNGPEWRKMWDATKAFAGVMSPGTAFPPAEGEKCHFCQQPVESDAAVRLKHLAEFVSSKADQEVRSAEADYKSLRDSAAAITPQRPDIAAVIAEIAVEDAKVEPRMSLYLSTAVTAQQQFANVSDQRGAFKCRRFRCGPSQGNQDHGRRAAQSRQGA